MDAMAKHDRLTGLPADHVHQFELGVGERVQVVEGEIDRAKHRAVVVDERERRTSVIFCVDANESGDGRTRAARARAVPGR